MAVARLNTDVTQARKPKTYSDRTTVEGTCGIWLIFEMSGEMSGFEKSYRTVRDMNLKSIHSTGMILSNI